MTDNMIELGKRAVACPKWRWTPGMLAKGLRVVSVNAEYRYLHVHPGSLQLPAEGYTLPDLSDPATVGCLLALVREAWGEPKAYVAARGEGLDLWAVCLPQPRADRFGHGATEAEALVAALESAP